MPERGPARAIGAALPKLLAPPLVISALVLMAAACLGSGASPPQAQGSMPRMNLEAPQPGAYLLPIGIFGWAIDLAAERGSGIDLVEVLDGGCGGIVLGVAQHGVERPDIAREYGEQFLRSGWQFQLDSVLPGDHVIGARARTVVTGEFNQCDSVVITVE